MFQIIFKGKEESGEWFDLGTRSVVKGTQYSYELRDEVSGFWDLNARIREDGKKADAKAIGSRKVGSRYDQIKRKSITFNETSDGQKFYNVIGIGYYVDEEGRFHSKRISNIDEVPEEIKSKFEIRKYEDVSPHRNIVLKDKLVVLVDKQDVESMVLLFFLEKIKPVFNTNHEE